MNPSETNINANALRQALSKQLCAEIIRADYTSTPLHSGTVGDVRLLTGTAETAEGVSLPYRIVIKVQKKWERYGDPLSWRREYDLYASELGARFSDAFRWPACYLAEMNAAGDETTLWMEYIDGVTGLNLTGDMYERAAYELGRFQGRLHAEKPAFLQKLTNLSSLSYMKDFYLHYRSWNVVYDFIRSESCGIPRHLCQMLTDMDDNAEAALARIEKLPVVLCHRDFWVTNILYAKDTIALIDWDTTGWGYLGEDIASLIADEGDVPRMVSHYRRCVPAYYKGFAEHADAPPVAEHCVWELIILMFGYRLVEQFIYAKSDDEKALCVNTLEQIYEMGAGQ